MNYEIEEFIDKTLEMLSRNKESTDPEFILFMTPIITAINCYKAGDMVGAKLLANCAGKITFQHLIQNIEHVELDDPNIPPHIVALLKKLREIKQKLAEGGESSENGFDDLDLGDLLNGTGISIN